MVSIYLCDVLQRISQSTATRVSELTPRKWKTLYADNPLNSMSMLNNPATQIKVALPSISVTSLLMSIAASHGGLQYKVLSRIVRLVHGGNTKKY